MSDLNVDQGALVAAAEGAGKDPAAAAPETTPSLTELDGLSEFTFQGEKYTPDKLHKLMGDYKSLSEQQRTFSEEQKFYNNLDADLENVLQDPRLAEKFKQVYPQKFHTILDKLLRDQRPAGTPSATAQPQPAQLPKEFLNEFGQMKERLKFHEQRAYDAEVASANAKLDSIVPPLLKKFPLAVEDQVYSRAENILQGGQKLTEKTWERIVRESHEAQQKRSDQFYGAKMKTQIEKGQKGADVGPGGATPGQAPRRPKTFDEAREQMLESLRGTKNG